MLVKLAKLFVMSALTNDASTVYPLMTLSKVYMGDELMKTQIAFAIGALLFACSLNAHAQNYDPETGAPISMEAQEQQMEQRDQQAREQQEQQDNERTQAQHDAENARMRGEMDGEEEGYGAYLFHAYPGQTH